MSEATIRAKMMVQSVKRHAGANGEITYEEVAMNAVGGPPGSVNEQWSKWTPSGAFTMHVNNPSACGKLLPGQFYFVDLIPTDKDG